LKSLGFGVDDDGDDGEGPPIPIPIPIPIPFPPPKLISRDKVVGRREDRVRHSVKKKEVKVRGLVPIVSSFLTLFLSRERDH
jgi:hypothetical protein